MVSLKSRFLIAAALALTVNPATAAPWGRGCVVDNYAPAFYYGGRSGTEEPGPDCPKGTIPILDYKTVLKTSWRTQAEIDRITRPVSTGGFTSPSGERGVDNAFYRAWGCIMSYRGTPWHAYLSQRANDKMLDGLYTMVIRLSGNADPMNDDHVTFEVAYSPDHVVKDPMGNVVRDVSFRVVKTEQYTM